MRMGRFLGMLALGLLGSAGLCIADEMPAFWAKSMTNDPVTNSYLARTSKPLPDHDAETMRIVTLVKVLGKECRGASVNKKALKAFMKSANYAGIKGNSYDNAVFLTQHSLKYFDYRMLAHLCAGSDYLFGPQGHLAAGLIKVGKGKPRTSYDPRNPYLRIQVGKS